MKFADLRSGDTFRFGDEDKPTSLRARPTICRALPHTHVHAETSRGHWCVHLESEVTLWQPNPNPNRDPDRNRNPNRPTPTGISVKEITHA